MEMNSVKLVLRIERSGKTIQKQIQVFGYNFKQSKSLSGLTKKKGSFLIHAICPVQTGRNPLQTNTQRIRLMMELSSYNPLTGM